MQKKQQKKKDDNPLIIYVAVNGNDRWPGTKQKPLATLHAAVAKARRYQTKEGLSKPVKVVIRGGTYFMEKPLVLGCKDSGTPRSGNPWTGFSEPKLLEFCAYSGEKVIISGGKRITGWEEGVVNGLKCWKAYLPEVKRGKWSFRQLWVNGQRRERPVLPENGFYRIESVPDIKAGVAPWSQGQNRFICSPGDIKEWENINDIEIHVFNFWIDERMWIKNFDPQSRMVNLDRNSCFHLNDEGTGKGAQYKVENVFEELKKPGQWYLDKKEGILYYIPLKDEKINDVEFIAPKQVGLIRIEGDDIEKKAARGFLFDGITFAHNEWIAPSDWSSSTQAANEVPGIINIKNGRHITFRNCNIEHTGTYGFHVESSFEVRIENCDIRDIGAGGVKIWHGCRRCHVINNEIADGGHLYAAGVGVLSGKTCGTRVIHNDIHDFYYSGVSVGWTWGYQESETWGNIIEHNHIHHLGKYMLSDMGGIYCLGTQPGTRLRFNLIHDVYSRTYGGWGIYTDEGSTHILIENNIVYNTKCGGFHQHYGCENIVQNNIFYNSIENQLARSRFEPHISFVFRRNICVIREGIFWQGDFQGTNAEIDNNLYWYEKKNLYKEKFVRNHSQKLSFDAWKRLGFDRHSVIADPVFKNPEKGDFDFCQNSPYKKIGFVPFSLKNTGRCR